MNSALKRRKQLFALLLFSVFFISPLLSLFAEELPAQTSAISVETKDIENRIESIRGKIVEVKADKEVFDYVIKLVERVKNVADTPRLPFRLFVAEILWTEKEMGRMVKVIRELSDQIVIRENRLKFIDRDIAIRELLNSFAKENPAIRESVTLRKQHREDFFQQVKYLKDQQTLQQLKMGLIQEYRGVLERNRWPRLLGQFSQKENVLSVFFYLAKRIALTLVLILCIAIVCRVISGLSLRILKLRQSTQKHAQTISGHMFKLIKSILFLSLIFTGVCLFLQIWDFGLSRLYVFWDFFKQAHFSIGATQIALVNLGEALFVLWLFWAAAQFVNSVLSQAVYPKFQTEESLQYSYSVIVRYAFFILGLILAMHIIGIPLSSLSLFTGALGIGVGFGLQELFKNFIAGLNLLMERQVKVGDLIQLGDLPGKVREINAQNTVVDTFDNISVVVPNLEFTNQRIINWSHSDKIIRTNLAVGVAYGSDTQLVRNTLLEVAGDHAKVLKKPEPSVIFEAFGDSSLNFKLFVWINEPENKMGVLSDLHFAVDQKFREKNIQIPFPQQDVHLKSLIHLPGSQK